MTLHDEIVPTLTAHAAELTPASTVTPDYIARVFLELGNMHSYYREPYQGAL